MAMVTRGLDLALNQSSVVALPNYSKTSRPYLVKIQLPENVTLASDLDWDELSLQIMDPLPLTKNLERYIIFLEHSTKTI